MIRCQLDDQVKEYEVEIEKINLSSKDNKGMEIHVTDPELLEKAGYREFDPKASYKAGDKVYWNNRKKALAAATFGTLGMEEGLRMNGAHIDSPRLDLKPNPLFEEVRLGTMQDGKCVEILHIGAFDDEPISFEKMEQFALANNLKRTTSYHREIYLNNANRVEKSKLKTILRYTVE